MPAGGVLSVEVRRGDTIESVHQVHAVVADRHGSLLAWGDRLRPTIPRSAIKAIQALPIVSTGAAEALAITAEELALACASHSGEPEHVAAVLGWLDRLGLSEGDLECGPDTPIDTAAARQVFAAGGDPSPVYNCCSGKHAGFLSVANRLGVPPAGYIERRSPVQQLVTTSIEVFTGVDLAEAPSGRDGCGIPVFTLPLERLAFAMARLVDPVDLDPSVAAATGPVVDAAQLAFWVSGTGRTEAIVSDRASQPVVIKGGAEGVFMVGLPARGLGVALKADDGSARAASAAVTAILGHLDVLAGDDVLADPVQNKAGLVVGSVRTLVPGPDHTTLAPNP